MRQLAVSCVAEGQSLCFFKNGVVVVADLTALNEYGDKVGEEGALVVRILGLCIPEKLLRLCSVIKRREVKLLAEQIVTLGLFNKAHVIESGEKIIRHAHVFGARNIAGGTLSVRVGNHRLAKVLGRDAYGVIDGIFRTVGVNVHVAEIFCNVVLAAMLVGNLDIVPLGDGGVNRHKNEGGIAVAYVNGFYLVGIGRSGKYCRRHKAGDQNRNG